MKLVHSWIVLGFPWVKNIMQVKFQVLSCMTCTNADKKIINTYCYSLFLISYVIWVFIIPCISMPNILILWILQAEGTVSNLTEERRLVVQESESLKQEMVYQIAILFLLLYSKFILGTSFYIKSGKYANLLLTTAI